MVYQIIIINHLFISILYNWCAKLIIENEINVIWIHYKLL